MPLPSLSAWTSLAPGLDLATGTNYCQTSLPNPPSPPADVVTGNVHVLRLDMQQPGLELLVTPWASLSPAGVKTTAFLNAHFEAADMMLMLAVNANYFDVAEPQQRDRAYGLAASQGQMLTYPYSSHSPYGLVVTRDNQAFMGTPAEFDTLEATQSLSPLWTAVAGNVVLVQAGRRVAPGPGVAPRPAVAARTAVGLSDPGASGPARYLYLLTIDGVELTAGAAAGLPPTYYGATMQDAANWLLAAGAYSGLNLDGGGSTTLARIDEPGQAYLLNVPHDTENQQDPSERAVAISLGVFLRKP